MHRGGQPFWGGSRLHGASQRSLLARNVLCGVGGTRPPRFAPGGGNGKGGDQISVLPQAELSSRMASADAAFGLLARDTGSCLGAPTAGSALQHVTMVEKPGEYGTCRS